MGYYIVGLDPGSTVGVAILDLDGNLISVNSFRNGLNETLSFATSYGKILLVGTDVSKVPKFVEKFATKIGASIVAPDYDLFFYEKRRKTKNYLKNFNIKLKDKHQMAALTAALVAYRHYKMLFNKINTKLADKEMAREIRNLVLIENIPIKEAARIINEN